MTAVLVTGSSGFIGFHTCTTLLKQWYTVIGIDNENDYYDVTLKQARRNELQKNTSFSFFSCDIADASRVEAIFASHGIDTVINLAAQAGVRYSIENPTSYIFSNVVGFHNLLQFAVKYKVRNVVYASTGSVYGNYANGTLTWTTTDSCEAPLSLYAATKKCDELIAHSYSAMFGLQTIGLRFYNVVGAWWRPDAAYFIFTKHILENVPIRIHNFGKMKRNNTAVEDIVAGIVAAVDYNNGWRYEIFNLGNERQVELLYFVEHLETLLGKKAQKEFVEMGPGEIDNSSVDSSETTRILGRHPEVSVEEALENFVKRYKEFYTT